MIRLALRVAGPHAELVLAELLVLAPAGLEERECAGGEVEFALYGEPGELPSESELRTAAGDALVAIESTAVAADWHERWREFHKPLRLGERLGVRPPWEPELGTEIEVVIDPGQAFGTGAHATTRLSLELLIEEQVRAAPAGAALDLVDLGCGSGVLSIAAAQLGWRRILALDNDPAAVAATDENAAVNGVAALIEARQCDLLVDPVPAGALTVANLLGPLLLGWCERIGRGEVGRPGRIIAAGLLATEADQIATSFAGVGYRETDRRAREQWAALRLVARG